LLLLYLKFLFHDDDDDGDDDGDDEKEDYVVRRIKDHSLSFVEGRGYRWVGG